MDNFTPKRAAEGIYEFTHTSGLTLLLVPKPGLNITTANITYRVGSRNEGLGVRGATHYLEHGMFKGSKNFNKKLKNGMWKLEEYGAYMNATTYTDRTNYFAVIDSDKLNEVVKREADRMFQPLLDECELKKEMTVVRNEFERGENNDFEVLQKRVMATAFMAHPYHHSTIGWRSEIENVSAEALRKFHDTFYKPSNATYTFCGNFDTGTVMEMVHAEFSKFDEADPSVPTMYTTEPTQMGQRRVMMQRPTNCALMCISFKAPNGLHHEAIVLEVIANIISKGPQALSEQFKKDDDLPIHDIIAEWERMRDPYLFSIWGTTNRATEDALQTAENTIHTITDMFQTMNMKEHIVRAKQYIKNSWDNEMLGTRNTAMAINEAIARGDPFDVHKRLEVLSSIDEEDVKRVAAKYFDVRRSTVGWLLPGDVAPDIVTETYPKLDTKEFQTSSVPSNEGASFEASNEEFTNYANGKADVRISIQDSGVSLASYVNKNLLADLIPKGFRLKDTICSENQLYEYLSQRNIQRHISPGVDALHIQASIPNEEKVIKSATGLLLHEMSYPILGEPKFMYLKNKWTSELYGSRSSVNGSAKIAFRQALFKPSDPNYKFSTQAICDQLNNTSYTNIEQAHKDLISGPKLVTVVAPNKISKLCNKGTWNRMYTNDLMATGVQNDIQLPGKSSAVLKYGMVVEYSDALKLAVAVLGNGFTGRLMRIVRDTYGLTYGINARLVPLKGCAVFEVTGTFSPKLLEEGITRTEEVIKQWLSDKLNEEEVQVQKGETIGSQNVQYDSPGALASAIHHTKIMYGSVDRINNYSNIIGAVTLDQINEAKSAITFEKLARVRVGTF
jgi:zinc protease